MDNLFPRVEWTLGVGPGLVDCWPLIGQQHVGLASHWLLGYGQFKIGSERDIFPISNKSAQYRGPNLARIEKRGSPGEQTTVTVRVQYNIIYHPSACCGVCALYKRREPLHRYRDVFFSC